MSSERSEGYFRNARYLRNVRHHRHVCYNERIMALTLLDHPDDVLAATCEPKQRLSRHGLDEGDLAWIRTMLSMSIKERLRAAEEFADSVEQLRRARPVKR